MKYGPSSLCRFPSGNARGSRLGFHSSVQCKRLYQAETSIKIPANGWFSLFTPCREESPCPEPVQFVEPFVDITDHRFEENPLFHAANSHPVALETELLGKVGPLAPPV